MKKVICTLTLLVALAILSTSALLADPIMTQPTRPGGNQCTPGTSYCSWMDYCDCLKLVDQSRCSPNIELGSPCFSQAETDAADCRVVGYITYGYPTHACTTGG